MIKVLFLTMYSGEGDYKKSCESVKAQKNIIYDSYTVTNKPMAEAHADIYSYWNEHSHEYDMFVKLDADMVLATDKKVIEVWDFIKNTNIAMLIVGIHDHLRNKIVPGTVFGTSHCKFNVDKVKGVACDRGIYIIENGYRSTVDNTHAPATLHGHYSLPIQMFAQGVKRRGRGQYDIYQEALTNFNRQKDILRFMFLVGWELGGSVLRNDFDYTNPLFKKWFNGVNKLVKGSELDSRKIKEYIDTVKQTIA